MQELNLNPGTEGTGAHIWLFALVMAAVAVLAAFELMDPAVCHFPEAGSGFQPAMCFEYWLNRYQTLIGGLLAIAAAGIAYIGVRQQIDAAQASQREQQRRENAAARALLPLALAKIIDHLTRSAATVRRIGPECQKVRLEPFPFEASIDLQNCLRWAEQQEAEQIWQLLACIQVFQSRYNRPFGNFEGEQCQIDLCDLLIKTERLFGYGRNGHLKPMLTREEIDHAVILLRLDLVADSLLDRYRSSLASDPGTDDFTINETEVE